MNQERRYLSYLLRPWQESAGVLPGCDQPLWRASLERTQSDMRQGFASLEDLFAFLVDETESCSPSLVCSESEAKRDGQGRTLRPGRNCAAGYIPTRDGTNSDDNVPQSCDGQL